MALVLEVLTGGAQGKRLALRDGLTIGRRKSSLTLEDSKVSTKHAAVQKRPDGSFWLVDQGSSNGIKTPQGRVRELSLQPGTRFTLGRTALQVLEDPHFVSADPISDQPAVVEWREELLRFAERAVKEKPTPPRDVKTFEPALELKFTKGFQTGTVWTVGYGPRSVGSSSLDLFLDDPTLPGICFRLVPEDSRARLIDEDSSQDAGSRVMLNGKWVKNALLNAGDVIEIKGIRLEIGFSK